MWSYNDQHDAGQGCWRKEVCSGNGSFLMFEERNIQFFCSEEQFAENADEVPPWNLQPLPQKPFAGEWKESCKEDADCQRDDLGQICTNMLWLAVKDASSYANGAGCYNWKNPVCPGPDFAAENYNYESTQWSWYTQYSCTSG